MNSKPAVIYMLHQGCTGSGVYGTERMTLDTLEALRPVCRPVLLAPEGAALVRAAETGFDTVALRGRAALALALLRALRSGPVAGLVTTSVLQSLLGLCCASALRLKVPHVHVVHGGWDGDFGSYGRKRLLNRFPVSILAVSAYAKEKLIRQGVGADRITVVPNFLSASRASAFARRAPFSAPVRRVAVISRLDPSKRVDLLIAALEAHSELRDLYFGVFGDGPELPALRRRAEVSDLPVSFHGFLPDVAARLAGYDALLHLCPVESFGLVVLEAFAAGLPVVVPDRGGTAEIVAGPPAGLRFRADDATDLARTLAQLKGLDPGTLNEMSREGPTLLCQKYSQEACLPEILRLLCLSR